MLHCEGCVTHGQLKSLERLAVHGDPCAGIDPDGEVVSLRAKTAKLVEEMNTIIRQKWDMEAERDTLRADLAATREVLRMVVYALRARATFTSKDGVCFCSVRSWLTDRPHEQQCQLALDALAAALEEGA